MIKNSIILWNRLQFWDQEKHLENQKSFRVALIECVGQKL